MPCVLLIKATEASNADPEKYLRGVHKIGDFINVKPENWHLGEHWPQSAYASDKFVCVVVSDKTPEELINYRNEWKDDFAYEVIDNTAAGYRVRVYEQNPGASNQNGLTRAKVEAFLNKWGCDVFSEATNEVIFDIILWDMLRSDGFWDVDLIGTKVSFNLQSYVAGVAQVQVTNVSIPTDFQNRAIQKITERGGSVISASETEVIFTMDKAVLLENFKSAVKRAIEKTYLRHRYNLAGLVSYCQSYMEGRSVTDLPVMTQAEVFTYLQDKMAE